MAEYYPLLAKAVGSLPELDARNSRRVVYERARKALIGQLRTLHPPVPDDDIEHESVELDRAIGRLESELARCRLRQAPPGLCRHWLPPVDETAVEKAKPASVRQALSTPSPVERRQAVDAKPVDAKPVDCQALSDAKAPVPKAKPVELQACRAQAGRQAVSKPLALADRRAAKPWRRVADIAVPYELPDQDARGLADGLRCRRPLHRVRPWQVPRSSETGAAHAGR